LSLYLDTSVLVPLHVHEPTSEVIAQLLFDRPDSALISDFGQVEFAAAIMARFRVGGLSSRHAEDAIAALERDGRRIFGRVEITSADVRRAELLVRLVSPKLRVPDAIHIAVCLRLDLILVSADREQLEAAAFHGVDTIAIS